MQVALEYGGATIGVLEVESKWAPDKAVEALRCYGTSSIEHPGVLMITTERGKYYVGGKVRWPRVFVPRCADLLACALWPWRAAGSWPLRRRGA